MIPAEVGRGGTLWLARHADVHNPQKIFYGRLTRFRLSKLGEQQATELGDYLSDKPLTALYCSPLLRTRQTAEAVAKCHAGLKVQTNQRLLEVRTNYQGVPLADLGDFNFYEPMAQPTDETLEELCERLLEFTRWAMNRHKGETIASVSHGDPVVVLHAYYTGLPLRLASLRRPNFYPERASVTRYDFPPEGFTKDPRRVRVSYYEVPTK
ncbi:MAG: histidine phosphatase family protein [Chloroflexota bacterium]